MLETVRLPHETKVNLVCFTDVHLAAKPIGRRRGSYMMEILSKLRWTAALATKIQGVGICGGDLFHIKNHRSDSNTHELLTATAGVFQQFPKGKVFGVVGNHDVTGDNLDTVPLQPIGALIQAGVYQSLGYGVDRGVAENGEPWNTFSNGVRSVIFEAGNGLRVRVDGFDYVDGPELLTDIKLVANTVDPNDGTWNYRVAVVHGFNQPGKSGLMFDKDFALGWDDLDDLGYDAFFWGHDHIRKGIHQSSKGVYHVQVGSLARAAFSKDETDRPVTVAVISCSKDGLLVAEREIPVRPLELAFHTADLVVEKVDRRSDVVTFLADLDKHASAVDTDNPMEALLVLTQEPAIITTITEVCELTT